MAQISKEISSKYKWKNKALKATYKIKKLKQVVAYNKKLIKILSSENKDLKKEIKAKSITTPALNKSLQVSHSLCVILNLNAVVSFRSVPKIIKSFELEKTPHFTSIINWTLRYGLGLLKQVSKLDQPWAAIIDHSIDFGPKKVLVVLRVNLLLLQEGAAITLNDCECIGIKIREKVTGELVALDLKEIFEISGAPTLIIKDCDAALNKGCQLWIEQSGIPIPIIPDIGHIGGNTLKAEFNNTRRYNLFVKIITFGASKLRQTQLAFAMPPKLRDKGRFQSIKALSTWAENMLNIFQDKERIKEDEGLKKIKKIFTGLVALKSFIISFSFSILAINKIMKLLKCEGFSNNSYKKSIEILKTLPKKSKTYKKLRDWLDEMYKIHNALGIKSIPVSSDIIESLFGKFKYANKRSSTSEMNKSVLLIPTLCGVQNHERISKAINLTTHKNLIDWELKEVGETIKKKKIAFFAQLKSKKQEEKNTA